MSERSEEMKGQLQSAIVFLQKKKGYDNTLKRAKKLLGDVSEETAKRKDFQGMVVRCIEAVDYIRSGGR